MNEIVQRHRLFRFQLAMIILGVVCFYFAYHLAYGQRGVSALLLAQSQVIEAQAELVELQGQRDDLHARVSRLRPGQVDPDFVEEQAMRVLGYDRFGSKGLIIRSEL